MVTIPSTEISLRQLKQSLGLELVVDANYFLEWQETLLKLTEMEEMILDRVKNNFLSLLEEPPLLENSVKMIVLSPLLDLAGFYQRPFRLQTETSVKLILEDEDVEIRGRLDILVMLNYLWLVVIESKGSDFAVSSAIPQTLSYMLANPSTSQPTFAMITNGNDFLFLKSTKGDNYQYSHSRLFSLFNPGNELYDILQILKNLGRVQKS